PACGTRSAWSRWRSSSRSSGCRKPPASGWTKSERRATAPAMVHHPLRLTLDSDALVSNWHWLAHKSGGAACGAAVKADAYGLGARHAVKRLQDAGCRDFFVSNWAEAEALMPWPSDLNLSVLHGPGPEDMAAALASPARPVLNSPAQVARWRETKRPCDVMIDTGINRLGP